MYLSNLEIVGFKSFAQKTKLKFSDGITCIVGPNGCGKTNIVDAIRWVLGEQKTSVLRSDVMENVIFNGTKNLKPLGMAEVSITFENNKKILPLEYDEVSVSRRLFRDGESNYLLNKTQCRLKDIQDLFMDTGMGPDSYSVIELKMIEAILSGKPEERRHLFEEAAGIIKYKTRRKETVKKLDSVQKDLERLCDILDEIEKTVNTLSRQAAKTKRYNNLFNQLKEIEIQYLKYQFHSIHSDKEKLDDELVHLKDNKETVSGKISELENFISELNEKHTDIEKKHLSAIENVDGIKSIISQKHEELAVSKEKHGSNLLTIDRLKKEIEENSKEKIGLNEKITLLTGKIEEKKKLSGKSAAELEEKRKERESAYRLVRENREILNSSNEEILTIKNQVNSLNESIRRSTVKKESLERKIESNSEEISKFQSQMEELEPVLIKKEKEKEELSFTLSEFETELQFNLKKKNTLSLKADKLKNQNSELKNSLNGKKATLEFLQNLIDDSDESIKYLINEKIWLPDKERIMLAELIGCDDKFRVAMDAALGGASRYFVVDSKEDAHSAFQFLKKKEKGKVSIIALDSIKEIKPPNKSVDEEGIYGWTSEIVRVDEKIRYVLRGILGQTLLVENIDVAGNVISSGAADCAVTLEGEIISSSGYLRGGSVSKKEGRTIGKKERIDTAKKEILILNDKISGIEKELKFVSDEIESVNINDLTKKIKNLESEKINLINNIAQLNLKKESINNNIKLFEQNNARFSEEMLEFDSENLNIKEELESLESQMFSAKEEYQSCQAELNEYETRLTEAERQLRNAELQSVELNSEIKGNQKELDNFSQLIIDLDNKINNKKNEINTILQNIELLKIRIIDFEKEINISSEKLIESENEKEIFASERNILSGQISQYSADLSENRHNFSRLLETIHEKELKFSQFDSELTNLMQKSLESYEYELSADGFSPIENYSLDETKNLIADIKGKLSSLGSVNFMALEEFESQSERLEFYRKQVKDLSESEKTLQETIEEINQTAENNFRTTFEKIQNNFKRLFKTLFSEEAEAELIFTNGNPLESDIEVLAKPPGKKPNTIEALSGGEKTLTAIALLFAIYNVKPSPFCILDEVDAPLDDANIDKFIDLIGQFNKDTQFLIVTHNKRTMEAANNLYGITMQEEGVSKIVSVKLDKAIE